MSEVRLIAGLLAFIIFVTSVLVLAGDTYPEIKPQGLDLALITPPGENDTVQPFTLDLCIVTSGSFFGIALPAVWDLGHIACQIVNFFKAFGNALSQFFDAVARGAQFTTAIILFRIPALGGDPTLQLINNIIAIPIWFGIAFTTFTVVRSLIPFIRGS